MQKDLLHCARWYIVAVVATITALNLRLALNPILGRDAPLLLFIMAVVVTAFAGGFVPGLAATALSGAAGVYYFLRIDGTLPTSEVVRLSIFVAEGVAISFMCGRWNACHERALGTQEELRQSKEESEAALKEMMFYKAALDEHAIVATTDPRGRITYANPKFCAISGYTRQELLGRDHRIINSGHHPKSFFADMYHTIARGEPWHGDIKNRAKDGSFYWVHTTVLPLKTAGGQIEKYMAIRADITELKRAEEELRRLHADLERRVEARTAELEAANHALQAEVVQRANAERALREGEEHLRYAKEAAEAASSAKSAFLANMSHEIRTPLTAIFGYADLLLLPDLSPAERAEHVQTIRRNGEHLLAILNDVLDVSKIEAGKMTVETVQTSLPQVVHDVASMMRPRAAEKGLQFQVRQHADLPETVWTDPTRLRQILINLVGNAVKFTNAGSVTLVIELAEAVRGGRPGQRPEPRLEIVVADTGIGMSPEQQALVFTPFTQADPSHARKFGGTGLGLAISYRLARLLGGDISLASRPNVGTTFTVSLPVGDLAGVRRLPDVMAAVRRSPRGVVPQETRLSGRVLVAEDSADNQRLICAYLRNAGMEVEVAENGRVAVEKASADADRPFDLVLMDCQMPEMDGYAATTTLRAMGWRGTIIALTANAMDHERDRCLEVGCDHFLTKPIQAETFLRTIRHYLDRRAAAEARAGAGADVALATGGAGGRADALLAPLIGQFLEELRGKVAAIQHAATSRDVSEVSRLAHQIKGAAGGYGFPQITLAAAAVETAVASPQTAALLDEPVRRLAALCDVAAATTGRPEIGSPD